MESPRSDLLGPRVSFEFAFNDADFSDRVLRIEIMADSLASKSNSVECQKNRKRIREELDKEIDSDSSAVVEVKTYHISSPILAGHSPLFLKLFKNGMRESHQKDATLRIYKSEEAAVMELLNFMYSNTLTATTSHDLLGVLIVADKFEVTSCMRYCSGLLGNIPMSLEFALLYLTLPPSVAADEVVQPLIDAAKKCLFAHCRNNKLSREDVIGLPLCAVEVVLGFRSLKVDNEEDAVDFALEWARARYPILEERQEIFTEHLAQCISFPNMSCSKLKQVLGCPEFDHDEVTRLVLEVLFVKFNVPKSPHTKDELRAIKVVRFDFSQPRCVVYFDLNKQECEKLMSRKRAQFDKFCFDGRYMHIFPQSSPDLLSFRLRLLMSGMQSCTLDYELAVKNSSSKEFQQKSAGKDCIGSETLKFSHFMLFEIPWIDFMSNDSEYFVDGVFQVRADFTINNTAV